MIEKELTEKCWLIKSAFNIDVQFIDKDLKTIIHISEDTEPFIITEKRKGMYSYFEKALLEAKLNSFCYYTDPFYLSFIAIAIKDEEQYKGMSIVGPFLNDKVTDHFLWTVMKKNHLEQSWIKPLEKYYKTIPYVGSSYIALGEVLMNLYANPHLKSHIITIKSNDEGKNHEVLPPQNIDQEGMNIKLRYEAEKKFFHFIEMGDKGKALQALTEYTGDFLYRVPGNPLRAKKNLAFGTNSMYRITAERGGVPPQYLHKISEKFSIKIEEAVTLHEIDALDLAMIEEYCDAVKNFAIKGHSSVVKKALMYINLNFHENINLQSVADEIGFNRTYLAKKFKEEMKISVIDYIQIKRIEEASFLIEQGRSSITDISQQVGFSSYHYFCKVFKNVMGMTASEYKNGKRVNP
jgi:AraC-like DNA-binding protein